jgi:superfamily I DNA/RNA helicase/RecB family exonuclease
VVISGFERGRPAASTGAPPPLDDSQRAVVNLPEEASAAVIGAPGTGKTTTLIELVADRVLGRGWGTDEVLVLTSTRAVATRLRDALALRLAVPTTGPMARTVNSLAFELVGDAFRAQGRPAPRLVTGGEQDADIGELLAGHLEDGAGPAWPDELGPEVRSTRRFRTELRELMMRATEYGVGADALRDLGRTTGHPEWVAAADFIEEYLQVVATMREFQLDSAELARFAVSAIDDSASSTTASDRIAKLRLVVVDDVQDATEATFAVLRALAARGVRVIAFGDPDVAVNAFRGGEADVLGRLGEVLGIPGVVTLTLGTPHRQAPTLFAVTRAVTGRIGAARAGRQRAAGADQAPQPDGSVVRIEASTPAREWATIARDLRERHLAHGVPWHEMAVIVRSRSLVDVVRRALTHAEVPARASLAGTALRDDHAARSLLTVVDVGTGRTQLTPQLATELLLGPFGGLDRIGLRRLRLALRAEELAGGGRRAADELLVDALTAAGRLATIDHRVARTADRLATTLAEVAASDGSISELLWTAWQRSGLARTWHEQAMGSGVVADEANRNLDGIVALFSAAKRFEERRPGDPPQSFLTAVLDADIPEDTLSPQQFDTAVLVTTPAGVVGLEFDTVVVAGLQDGAWPNLRLRGSLLAPQQLVRVVMGIDPANLDERRLVRDDELRMFALAVSRARSRLVLAAVANDDEAPSPFLGVVPPSPVLRSASGVPFTLRALTGQLRRELVDRRNPARASAASALAELAALGVPGADPAEWHGLIPPSTTAPLYDGESIPVSPSAIDKVEKSALDWFVDRIGGSSSGLAANFGTIMHWAMESTADPTVEALWAAIESRWNELLFEAPWLDRRQKDIARKLTVALTEYLGDFARDGKALVAAEHEFLLEVDRAQVRGSIDRVERHADGTVVIVDLKTGSAMSKAKVPHDPQLAAYQLAYSQGHLDEALAAHGEHRSGGAKLLYVKEGRGGRLYKEELQLPFDEEGFAAFRERIRVASTLIAAAAFAGSAEVDDWALGDVPRMRLIRVRAVSSD